MLFIRLEILYSFLSDLIFEDAYKSVGSHSVQFTEVLYWKWEASSKNNALNYLVRRGSSAGKGIIFYFLTEGFLIALWWLDAKNSVQYSVFSIQKKMWFVTVWHRASVKAIYYYDYREIKIILLLGLLVLWVLPFFLEHLQKQCKLYRFNQLVDKTVNVNVLENNGNRKLPYGMLNVLNGTGEVVVFFYSLVMRWEL